MSAGHGSKRNEHHAGEKWPISQYLSLDLFSFPGNEVQSQAILGASQAKCLIWTPKGLAWGEKRQRKMHGV